jgi:hypothetical protein
VEQRSAVSARAYRSARTFAPLIDKGLADVAAGRVKDFDAAWHHRAREEAISRPLVLRLTDAADDLACLPVFGSGT